MFSKPIGFGIVFLTSFLSFGFLAPTVHAAPSPLCPFTWASNLKMGSVGNDVLKLQQFLNSDPATVVALSGAGSVGMESTTYGSYTKQAVVKFQEKYAADILAPNKLLKGTGIVGVSTRTKLNLLCETLLPQVLQTSPAPAGSSLSVTLASEQPHPSLAPSGALYVPFTRVMLTAGAKDVTVSRVTIERAGPSVDVDFTNADLLDEYNVPISIAYFNSNHQATFKDSFVVPAGTSKTMTIAGDMAVDLTGHEGEVAAMKLISIEADAPVEGLLPIVGASQTMNSTIAIGVATATLSPDDPAGDRIRYISDTGITFSGIRVSAGPQEDIRIDSITWEQNGTASVSDTTNLATVVQGISYPAEVDGRLYTSVFPEPFVIQKGNSLDIKFVGDLTTTGSNRTVKFDINDAGYVALTGTSYGFGIYLIPEDHTNTEGNSIFTTEDGSTDTDSIFPFFSGSVVTISPGAITGIDKI